MCGIAGFIARIGRAPEAPVIRMQERLRHRGPDAEGLYLKGCAALAHTRLSIIDVANGDQPFLNGQEDICLVANGEIYNHQQIRQDLKNGAYAFQTQSDCETILPLYEVYGRDCTQQMRGMFAFALWDNDKRKLLLGRDRAGEKPLYYYYSDQHFIFSSELRSLLASDLIERDLDPTSIARYFRYQYVPEPATPFKNVFKLPAGHTLVLDQSTWKIDIQPYWSAWAAPAIEGDPTALIRESLSEAVQTSLISDVPIGLSLSGGVDSSALAYFMRQGTKKNLHAFSVGYADAAAVDERHQAKALAQKLDIQFHDIEIPDSEIMANFFETTVAKDEPIGDISGASYLAIMKRAQEEGIKVILQGHGLDELCWGYPWVKDSVGLNDPSWYKFFGEEWRNDARTALSRERVITDTNYLRPQNFTMLELAPYAKWVLENAATIFAPDFLALSGWADMSPETEYGTPLPRLDLETTRIIMEFYLLGNGITQGDRLSMNQSIEVRLPFVDHKFIETIIGLRKASADHDLPPKYWLKQSMRGILDDEILDRPKRGFSPPSRWQALIREQYGDDLKNGYLVHNNIITRSAAERFSAPIIRDQLEARVSRLAIILELWVRGLVLEHDHAHLPI